MDVDGGKEVGNVVLNDGDMLLGTGLRLDNVEGELLEVVVLCCVVVLGVELMVLSDDDELDEMVVEGMVEELAAAMYPDVTRQSR